LDASMLGASIYFITQSTCLCQVEIAKRDYGCEARERMPFGVRAPQC
jgi:hypothetical protein